MDKKGTVALEIYLDGF